MLDDELHDSIHIEISGRAAPPSLTNGRRRPTPCFSSGRAIKDLDLKAVRACVLPNVDSAKSLCDLGFGTGYRGKDEGPARPRAALAMDQHWLGREPVVNTVRTEPGCSARSDSEWPLPADGLRWGTRPAKVREADAMQTHETPTSLKTAPHCLPFGTAIASCKR